MIRKAAFTTGLALALASGVAAYKSARNDTRVTQTHPPIGDFLTIDGTKIHYKIQGSGPPLVLLHGAGGNLRDFTFSLSGRLAQTHTVITFDRPGHGYTETIHQNGESPAEQAALLKSATDVLGFPNAIVGGYSYGGGVALAWALDNPNTTSGLLLMNAVSNPWVSPPSKLYELAAGRFTGPVMATTLSAFAPQSLVQDTLGSLFAPKSAPDGWLDYIGAGLSLRKSSLRANGKQVHTLLPHIESQSLRYPSLTLPIEIIHGAQDTTIPPSIHSDVLAAQVPHANYTLVDGVGHSVHHHAQDQILNAVARLTAASNKG